MYVGQTRRTIAERWEEHTKAACGQARCVIHQAIKKHGPQSFTVSQLAVAETEETLNNLERYWIDTLETAQRKTGYNRALGVAAPRHSDETRAQIGATHRGFKHSEESRQKMSKARKGKTPTWLKGKTLSPEHIAKLIAAKNTPEYHAKTSAIHKARGGRPHTAQSRRKIGEANARRIWTPASRAKASATRKAMKNG